MSSLTTRFDGENSQFLISKLRYLTSSDTEWVLTWSIAGYQDSQGSRRVRVGDEKVGKWSVRGSDAAEGIACV
jgi:hypothetical protein